MSSRGDCKIVVYPSYGYAGNNGESIIRVAGVVYEHRNPLGMRKQFLVNMLARAMNATPDELGNETFRQRVAPFVAKTRRGQRVWLQIGGRRYRLRRRTRRGGWFRGKLRLSNDFLQQLRHNGDLDRNHLRMRAWLSADDHIETEGSVFILPAEGISIVSDIDDTIKETNVGNRRELLANTFLREFRGVRGMSELYQSWADKGAAFHYVSSSPWQLYAPILQWTSEGGFPPGTLHLRTFRLRDQIIRRRANAKRRKRQSIAKMMRVFPRRKFVLIGDSGERDPELYSKMCRKYGDRIAAVFIRELDDQPLSQRRRAKMFAKASPVRCEVFRSADDLQQLSRNLFGTY